MKKSILVIFGGRSSEHDVSVKSVCNVIEYIDTDKYEPILVGITKEGEWKLVKSIVDIKNGSWVNSEIYAYLQANSLSKHILIEEHGLYTKKMIDAAFPVMHGLYGEDGSIQGLFELAGLPYVGCGIIASACGMDKFYTKLIVDSIGIRQAKYVGIRKADLSKSLDECIERVELSLEYPVFVKPSNAGSSIGVNKANNRNELAFALKEASKHDKKILVEEFIKGREIECAILGDFDEVKASGVGEIKAAAEFYDFDAKYNNPESLTIINPDIDEKIVEKIRESAIAIFKALDAYGLSRVDFFVTESKEIIFNEINTLPGFTAISMYPMLWEARGIDKFTLFNTLIEQAFRRY